MTTPPSVGGSERIRLFLGLRLPGAALDVVEAWQHAHLERMRIVPRGQLHLTLAFLGHRPAADLPAVLEALRAAAGAVHGELRLTPVAYRETRSVAMLVCGDERRPGRGASRPISRSGWNGSASTAGRGGRGSRTSPWAVFGSSQDSAQTWRTWEHMFSFRPTPLLICPGYAQAVRSMRFSRQLP